MLFKIALYILFLCLISIGALPIAPLAFATHYVVKVGGVLPFTGELAYVGNDIREGVTLALEELSTTTNVRFEFIWEDGKFAPAESVSAAQKLISVDKVDSIISLWDTADVIAPVTEKAKVVQLSIRWNPDVAARHKYTFTFESTYPTYYRDMARLIRKQGLSKVVFLHEETQAGARERIAFEDSAKAEGLELLGVESFPTGTNDFRGVLTRLLSKNPEIIANEGFPPASLILLKNLKSLRPQMRHIGFYEAISDPELIEGQPFVSQIGSLPEFSEKFERRFGHPFKIRAPHGFEVVRLLHWACSTLAKNTKPSPSDLRDQLEKLNNFQSVLGPLSINGTRNIEHPNTLKVMRSGHLVAFKGPQ